jgi:hypothetical protein
MSYNKEQIFEQSKEIAVSEGVHFIEDIVAHLPITKTTFYVYFPINSDELNYLKGLLEINRTKLKVEMRKDWRKSNSPALQMALMKLIATPDELRALSMNTTDVTSKGESINQPIINIIRGDIEES